MCLTRSASVFYALTQHFFLYKWGNCCSDILGCTISVKILIYKNTYAYYIYGIVYIVYTYTHTLYMDIHYFYVYLTNTHYPASGTATSTRQKGEITILTWFWDYQNNCVFFSKLKVLRRNHIEKFISPFHTFFKCLQSWSLHHS